MRDTKALERGRNHALELSLMSLLQVNSGTGASKQATERWPGLRRHFWLEWLNVKRGPRLRLPIAPWLLNDLALILAKPLGPTRPTHGAGGDIGQAVRRQAREAPCHQTLVLIRDFALCGCELTNIFVMFQPRNMKRPQ